MTAMNSEKPILSLLLRLLPWGLCAALVLAFSVVRNAQVPGLALQTAKEPKDVKQIKENPAERDREKAEHERYRRLHSGPVTEEEWKQAKEFLETNSPNRYRRIMSLERRQAAGLKTGNFEGLKRVLVGVWLDLSVLKDESPELYVTRLREVKLEDEIFGICLEMQKHGAKQEQSEHLKTKVAELFDVGLIERQQRIALVETAIREQKKSLVSDQANKTQLVSQRFQFIVDHGVAGARLDLKHSVQKFKSGSTTSATTQDSDPSETGTGAP